MLGRHPNLNSSTARNSHEQLDELNRTGYDPTKRFLLPVNTRANSDSMFNDNRDWAPWEELCRFVDLMDTQRLQTEQCVKQATSDNNRFSYPKMSVSKQSGPHWHQNALTAKRTKSDYGFYPDCSGSNAYKLKSVTHVERDNNCNDWEEYQRRTRKSNERGVSTVSDLNRDYEEYRKSQVKGQQCLQRQQHRINRPYSVVNKETSLPSSYSTSQSLSVDYTPATYHRRHHSHQFPISHPTNPNKTLINGTVIAKKEHPTESSAYCGRLSPSKRSKSIDFDAANFKTGIDSSRSRSLINVGRQFHPSYSQFTLPSESFHSKFHPFHRSLCLSQPAHETSAIRRQQRSTIELATFNGEESRRDSKRLEELDKLIEVERLKRKLAKMSLRPHYQQSSSTRSQRSAAETISNWSVAEPSARNTSNLQRQSRRQLVRYPTLYGLPPSEVSDDRYKPDRPSVERSLSIVSNYSCANDASVKCHCGDEISSTRMNANGTNLFALSTANIRYIDDDDDVSSRNASMFAKRGRPNDHSSSSNTYSYHTPSPLNSSINSFDFIAAPYSYCGTAMCSQRDGSDGMHSVIDQPALPTDTNDFMDNLRNTCLHQNHSHQSLLVPINEQFHSHPTMSGSTQNVHRADKKYKIDEGFTVTASSRGRLNARINRSLNRNHYCCGRFHPDIPTEKRIISRSCDGLNMQQSSTGCCQFRFDRFPAMLHRCETETLNSIDECCANSPEFGSTSSTSNAKLSRIQSAFERVLKRATSSISNQPSRLTAPYLSMNNLIINENDTETCFEPTDDGTESLDRRGWQQRALGRAGGQNGSTHNLMNVSAINGSNALYQEGPGVAIVDGPTTPQRLANFFARPFRTNPLKRTKSSSKLDRKRVTNDPEYTASRPDLQRSQENVCTLGSSSIYGNRWPLGGGFAAHPSLNDHNPLRSSRSHESLLSYSTTSHMIDMGASDVRVQPIHPSVLDVPNCFKVANTYYACRTPHERNRWIENLRRTMNPHRDEIRRTENALEIWILEAKGVPMKRRYYCEICLDKTLVGRTSAKPRADICFWGEHFDYSPIPKVDDLCINLYRDADPKKKKDRSTLIGYVQIKIDQLAARHPVERWYTVTASSDGSKLPGLGKDKGETAAIRVKARYQSVDILPLYMYDDLVRFLRLHYLSLCLALEPLLGVKAKEDCATAMVRIMHKQRLAKEFLCDLIMSEVDVLDNEHLMFRGNSLATKAMEAYMKLVADEYLKETLGEFVKSILETKESCEVDPLKMVGCNQTILERNRQHLTYNVQAAWGKIVNSTSSFPLELRDIFDSLRRRLEKADRRDLADTLISSSIFLRFLCPAILSPSLFNLVSEYPSGPAARNLTLIAKTLQTLANFTKFGGKEHYMEFMNEFVSREWDNMHHYLMRISTAPPRNDKQSVSTNESDSYNLDVGKEISLLHGYLDEIWTQQVQEQVIAEDHSLEDLRKILTKLDMRRQGASDSCIDMHEYDSRNAQSPASDYDNTGLLKSRNHNVPAYPYVRGIGQAQVMSRSTPASHLGTNDDYVLDIALLNDSLAVRQAGICVQQHRSAQHKNHRQAFDFPPKERSKPRNSPVVHSTLNGESHSHTSVFQNCDNVSAIATTSSSNISRVSPKSFNTALTNRHTENDTDSDDEDGLISQQMRHPRPPRKGKRRVVNGSSSHSRHETPTRTATTVVASQPPSSGYQSQNHSSSLSSSNSSSPVERSNPVNAVECTSSQSAAALKIANKMFTQHSAMPSTSYHPSQKHSPKDDHLTMDASASATATATIDSPQCYRSSAHLATSETATVHDVTKCSLPRTNPRYSGRSSYGTAANIGVVKPTLIDVGNDNDISTATAMPVRSGDSLNESGGDLKHYDDVWTVTERRKNLPNRWKNAQSVDVNVQQNQQEIIEQQKREILRLLKENEELKKHVASSQQNTNSTHISIEHENGDVQPFADSGASEDSYDSLSSFSDHAASLPQKAATHC